MVFVLHILARPLAPDCIGLGILFLVALAFLHGWGHQLHERTVHRPH